MEEATVPEELRAEVTLPAELVVTAGMVSLAVEQQKPIIEVCSGSSIRSKMVLITKVRSETR